MESQQLETAPGNGIDLSALAWIQDELRRSLDAAHKALRRFTKETAVLAASDVDAVDPSVLRAARQQFHQGAGALELIGLSAAAQVLQASESLVQRAASRPKLLKESAVDTIERASFALLDYLSRLLAGKCVSALMLFPQYRAVLELAGSDRIHPAELWSGDWHWVDLPPDPSAQQFPPNTAVHRAMEKQLLTMMRAGTEAELVSAHDRMSQICADLGAGATQTQTATLWKLAAAVYEAQAQGLLQTDVFVKRLGSRLLAQLRMLERGESGVSERLARDLLFFCTQSAAPGDGRPAPRLAAVRRAYHSTDITPADYTVSILGRFDPALIAQARKRVASAKDAWAAAAGGERQRLAGLTEQFALVGDSLRRLHPSGELLAQGLLDAVGQTQRSGTSPSPSLAMEVATSLLYLDASLADADFDGPQQEARASRLADRMAAVCAGNSPEPLEAWVEELYRRVSDRQTLGSVVQELRTSLSESEKLIDQFFRNPSDKQVLIPVPAQLSAMRGVLSVLGLDHASQAVLRMRDDVDGLIATEIDPERAARTGTFDRLAGNMGALGFLIDMFSVQPDMAKSLFVYDPQAGTLRPVMGRTTAPVQYGEPAATRDVAPRLVEQVQALALNIAHDEFSQQEVVSELGQLLHEAQVTDQPALVSVVSDAQAAFEAARDNADVSAARAQLSEALVEYVCTTTDGASRQPLRVALADDFVPAPVVVEQEDAQQEDIGMRDVFLQEAREVLADAHTALDALDHAPSDFTQLAVLRRAFHTLKGSSRMVGLNDFGDAAWVCEQVYNTRIAEQRRADPPLLEFSARALEELGRWVEAIADAAPFDHRLASSLKAAADALAAPLEELPSGVTTATDEAISISTHLEFPPNFPAASDLDLSPDWGVSFEAVPTQHTEEPSDFPPVDQPIDVATTTASEPLHPPLSDSAGDGTTPPTSDLATFDLGTEDAAVPAAATAQRDGEPEHAPVLDDDTAERDTTTEQPEAEIETKSELEFAADYAHDEQTRLIGPLRISIPLFNIYLNEADELSRRLCTKLAEWAMELHRPVGEATVALAHSLAGSSATVGFEDLSQISRMLEHALSLSQERGHGTAEEAQLFIDTGDEVRRLLHQFAAGFLKTPPAELLARLSAHEADASLRMRALGPTDASVADEQSDFPALDFSPAASEVRVETNAALAVDEPEPPHLLSEGELTNDFGGDLSPAETGANEARTARESSFGALSDFKPLADLPIETARVLPWPDAAPAGSDGIDAVDAIDAELFPIFEEECQELLPQLGTKLREWACHPDDSAAPAAAMRVLHTLKGGARLAGAMRLGELCHVLEGRIEYLLAHPPVQTADLELLLGQSDALTTMFDALRSSDAQATAVAGPTGVPPPTVETSEPPLVDSSPAPPPPENGLIVEATTPSATAPGATETALGTDRPDIDWSRFPLTAEIASTAERATAPGAQAVVRVRAQLLDGLINQVGEVSITRTRIEADVGLVKGSLTDLTENLERLRGQLRELELQGEIQGNLRMEAAKVAAQAFDPLEFDRFTRFQELTRMMAESVNDVATVQRTLQRAVESTEDELAAQMRLMRDLQDDLLRTRMVEFESQADRLYRVVRQAAKETGKQVRLDIVGGSIELDRGVLERMIASFEHLLRNCVTHGIEAPPVRTAAGKDPVGTIIVALHHEGNEVAVEFRDDGGGLKLAAIRDKGIALGLLDSEVGASDAELANLIFKPGFSTADSVTELAGRGVGMDVVLSEVSAVGGRIETATATGRGTSFKLVLPLTTAVTQVVMLRCGDEAVAVPSTLVEIVRRTTQAEVDRAYADSAFDAGEHRVPFFWLGALLQTSPRSLEMNRPGAVVVIHSAQQRIALHVDEVLGNQEVVVKNLGPQLSRLPGLVGVTLLAAGAVALIYNPVALAMLYGDAARDASLVAMSSPLQTAESVSPSKVTLAPLVLVVDDSLTVRRVTQRLLTREGYRVQLAKDGIDALERLADEKPQVVLSDIEMPRMDGFDFVRNIRGDARLRDLPVIMITSRIAQKHRDHAVELGVDHYLGKPYSEEDLLALISRYTSQAVST